jgi:hypothetical protein
LLAFKHFQVYTKGLFYYHGAASLRIQDVIFKTKPRHRFVVFMTKALFFYPLAAQTKATASHFWLILLNIFYKQNLGKHFAL